MPRTKSKASPQKHPHGLATATATVPHSQETTIQRRSRRRDPFPSLTVVTAGETVAQSVTKAAKVSAFAHNLNDSSIGNSSNSDDEDSDDDEDSEDDSMTNNSSDDDAEEKNSNEDDADPHHYSKLVDSSLLEDDKPSVSYRVDWVKGKGAGQKSIKGRPLNPTDHLCQQMMQKMQLTDGKKIGREIGISFGGIGRVMLMDAALLMEVPLTILDVLMAFFDLW
jgi:hypothetical protein